MAKRFYDSEMFKDPWYRKLKPNNKCLWHFILMACDHAGIWKADFDLAQFVIGGKFDLEYLNEGKKRVIQISDDSYFVPDFVTFQYGKLVETNNLHISVINKLREKNLWDEMRGCLAPGQGLGRGCQGALDIYKEKDKALNNSNKNEKPKIQPKIKYSDEVEMTLIEYDKLVVKWGEDFTKACIERLDLAIGSKGYKYKSHYKTILGWVQEAERESGEWENTEGKRSNQSSKI